MLPILVKIVHLENEPVLTANHYLAPVQDSEFSANRQLSQLNSQISYINYKRL